MNRESRLAIKTGDRSPEELLPTDPETIVDRVRERYGRIARDAGSGCCGPSEMACCGGAGEETSHRIGYGGEELAEVPGEANLGLGCGAPVGRLELKSGETVLDLGSGPGLDALLAARAVGPDGKVIGVDMTPEMNPARQGQCRGGRSEASRVP